jgi:hypothetical protein
VCELWLAASPQKKFLSCLSHCGHLAMQLFWIRTPTTKTKEACVFFVCFYFLFFIFFPLPFVKCSSYFLSPCPPLGRKICGLSLLLFLSWCTLARIEVEPMLALSISYVFFWPLEVTILFIQSTIAKHKNYHFTIQNWISFWDATIICF